MTACCFLITMGGFIFLQTLFKALGVGVKEILFAGIDKYHCAIGRQLAFMHYRRKHTDCVEISRQQIGGISSYACPVRQSGNIMLAGNRIRTIHHLNQFHQCLLDVMVIIC